MTRKKIRKNKQDSGRFSCLSSRRYLTTLFLLKVNEMKCSTKEIIELSGVCRSTLNNIKRGGIPNLSILRCLFAAPFRNPILTPEQAGVAVAELIADNLPDNTYCPNFRVMVIPEEHDSEPPIPLPMYMKRLRTQYLNVSMREVCRRFDHCDFHQLSAIESDCYRVGIGPVCYLFNNYLSAIPSLPQEEWGAFATLILHHLFPAMSGYRMLFIDKLHSVTK